MSVLEAEAISVRGETINELKKYILECKYNIPEYVSEQAQSVIGRMLELDISRRASILELKEMTWLKDAKFTGSYIQVSMTPPNEKEPRDNPVEKSVQSKLNEYGITTSKKDMQCNVMLWLDMIKGATEKGVRDAIVGTYRIVLYQHQTGDLEDEHLKINGHLIELAERNKLIQQRVNSQSKTCEII